MLGTGGDARLGESGDEGYAMLGDQFGPVAKGPDPDHRVVGLSGHVQHGCQVEFSSGSGPGRPRATAARRFRTRSPAAPNAIEPGRMNPVAACNRVTSPPSSFHTISSCGKTARTYSVC